MRSQVALSLRPLVYASTSRPTVQYPR